MIRAQNLCTHIFERRLHGTSSRGIPRWQCTTMAQDRKSWIKLAFRSAVSNLQQWRWNDDDCDDNQILYTLYLSEYLISDHPHYYSPWLGNEPWTLDPVSSPVSRPLGHQYMIGHSLIIRLHQMHDMPTIAMDDSTAWVSVTWVTVITHLLDGATMMRPLLHYCSVATC